MIYLHKNLRKLVKQSKKNAYVIAKELNIPRSTFFYYMLKDGISHINIGTLRKLCDYFDIDAHTLIYIDLDSVQ